MHPPAFCISYLVMTGLDKGVEKDYRAKTSNQMDSRELRGTASESFMPDWQAARKVKEGFLGQSDGHFGIPFSCPHLLSFCMKVIVYARRHRHMAGFLILGRAWRGFDPSRSPVFKNDTQSLEWASTKIYDCSACVCVRVGTCMLVRGTLFPRYLSTQHA